LAQLHVCRCGAIACCTGLHQLDHHVVDIDERRVVASEVLKVIAFTLQFFDLGEVADARAGELTGVGACAAVGVGADVRARELSDVAPCGALSARPEGCGCVVTSKLPRPPN